jgi:hypothetical protein
VGAKSATNAGVKAKPPRKLLGRPLFDPEIICLPETPGDD